MAGEEPADELFGLAPEAFVAARDELARRLRRAGDPGAAAAVRALRRPPLSAWAVNQLARRRGPELAPLLAGEREAVAGLVAAALELLREAGHPPTAATRARVAATLEAAAADPAAAELVRRGRLTTDLGPAGDGDGHGGRPRRPGREDAAARARRGAAVAARDEAGRRARLAADQAVLATRQAERLGRLADQAEREAARARAAAGAAIEAASAARERAARAARELHDAEDRIPGDR